jgi:GNAT superfamily N-acetyltransferase
MPIIINEINNRLIFHYTYRNNIASTLEVKPILREDISIYKGMDLISIYTYEKYRGKGYALKLMEELIKFCKKNEYAYILTDDATDVPPPKNIYYKMGFLVKDDDGVWTKWMIDMQPDEERLLIIK